MESLTQKHLFSSWNCKTDFLSYFLGNTLWTMKSFSTGKELSRGFETLKKSSYCPRFAAQSVSSQPFQNEFFWHPPYQGNVTFPTAQETGLRQTKGTQAKQGHQQMILGGTFTVGHECLTTGEEAGACKGGGWQRKIEIRGKQQLQWHCAAARKAEGQKVNYATELEAVALQNGNSSLHHEGTGCIWRLNLVLSLGLQQPDTFTTNSLSDGIKQDFNHPPRGSCLDGQYAQGSGEITAPGTVQVTGKCGA